MNEIKVDVKDKYCLTIDEACVYFNIGEKKMRKIVAEQLNSGMIVQIGNRQLIKRKRFERFIEDTTSF